METCVTPYPETLSSDEVAGGKLKPFPERLNAVPPRIAADDIPGVSIGAFYEDNKMWQKYVESYKRINKLLDTGRYRNIMDMNAYLGSFAAAIESPKLWVMNVVPTLAERDTLGVIYERGLIGIYHDWYFSSIFTSFCSLLYISIDRFGHFLSKKIERLWKILKKMDCLNNFMLPTMICNYMIVKI